MLIFQGVQDVASLKALVCVKSLSNVSTTAGMAFDFGKEKDTVPGRSPGVGK